MYNSGFRSATRTPDGVGTVAAQVSFVQKSDPTPTILGWSIQGSDDRALDPAGGQTVVVAGAGFTSGMTVTVGVTAIGSVTIVSDSQATFTAPAKTAGNYTLTMANSNGQAAILVPGLAYSTVVTWSTAAGSIGSTVETTSFTESVVATADSSITYSLASGSLPTGATLNANGTITGTAASTASPTTYSFAIIATDAELQDSTQSFTITVNPDTVTWVSPANGTSYSLTGGQAMSNVTLSATATTGSGITYTANALPTGVTLSGNTISGTPTVAQTVSTLLTATANTTTRYSTETVTWTVVFGDIYWPNVSLLLNGSTPTTSFINDASLNNNALTIAGDTKPNPFTPYENGYYSNYFDGTGDYLTIPDSTSLQMGTGDFTIEFWIYYNSIAGYQTPLSKGYTASGDLLLQTGNGNGILTVWISGSAVITESTGASAGQWYHYALVRSGTTVTLYRNGVSRGTATSSVNFNTTNQLGIGATGKAPAGGAIGDYPINGYLSNFRVVKGSAVYTSAFTPPSSPLTVVANTSLLTCQSPRLIDNSNNNFTITKNGDTSVSPAIPFVTPTTSSYNTQYSTYFDGTGDYLSAPASTAFAFGTGDYTLEFWVYSNRAWSGVICLYNNNSGGYFLQYNTGTGLQTGVAGSSATGTYSATLTANTWNHIAVSRASGSSKCFVNGTQVGTTLTDNTNYAQNGAYIGALYNGDQALAGQISNLRVVKGTALYTTNFTPSTTPLTAVAGTSLLTCQNATLIDNSTNNFAITSYGQAQPIALSPFTMTTSTNTVTSLGSHYFSATSAYSTVSMGGTQAFGTGDFTVECWLYMAGTTAVNISMAATATTSWELLTYGNQLYWHENGGNLGGAGYGTVPTNAWVHLAVSRKSSVLKMFVNGVQVYSAANTYNYSNNTTVRSIGPYNGGSAPFYVNDFRVINGTGLYTANFLPPQALLTPVTNTQLLTCQYNGGANNNGFVDQSSFNNIITRTGNPTQGTFSPYSPTGWGTYFTGANGDYLTWPTAGNATIGKVAGTKVTYEFWYYQTTTQAITAWVSGMLGSMPAVSASGRWYIALVGTSATSPVTVRYAWTTGTASLDTVTTTATLAQNQWNHVAVCIDATTASNTTITIYLNGVGQTFTGKNLSDQSATYGSAEYIGWNGDVQSFSGYISNLRVVRGQTVYTGNFTPPTGPLKYSQLAGTNISAITPEQTVLLTCQNNRFVDNSQYNYAITVASGSPRTQAYSPFGGVTSVPTSYSNYFDGTGDYLQMPDSTAYDFTGDFTMEAWIYPTTLPNDTTFLSQWTSGGWCFIFRVSSNLLTFVYWTGSGSILTGSAGICTISTNKWTHVAVTRSGSTIRLFVNGVVDTNTATYAGTIAGSALMEVGGVDGANNNWTGYISNVRIVKGQALYTTTFTPSTTPLTTTSQGATASNVSLLTCQSPTIIDNSPNYFTITANGNTQPYAYNPFGTTNTTGVSYTPSVNGGSMYFDGNGDYLTVGTFAPGTNNFTVDFWFYCTALPASGQQGMFFATPWGGGNFQTYISSDSTIIWQAYTQNNTNVAVKLNQWYHVAVVKNGSTGYFYINGVLQNTATLTNGISGTAYVGARGGDALYFTGYISDMRTSVGSVLYTSNFYPGPAPATPTTTIGSTTYASTLLLNGTSGGIIDYHGSYDLETVGNTQLAPQDPYAGNYYSTYFDGTGDYLTVPNSTNFAFGTGDFTIEFWMRTVDTGGGVINQSSTGWAIIIYGGSFYWQSAYNATNLWNYTATAVLDGKWHHVAFVRATGATKLYYDGVQVASNSDSTNYGVTGGVVLIGRDANPADFQGNLSNMRVVKGTAVYTSAFTPPTAPLTSVSGTSLLTFQSNKFVDNSSNNLTLTVTGNTAVQSSNPFQNNTGKSLYFDGTSNALLFPGASVPSGADSAFTFEFWIYPTALSFVVLRCNGNASSFGISTNASGQVVLSNTFVADFLTATGGAVKTNAWNYIAITRTTANLYTVYLNGTSVGSGTYTTSLGEQPMYIGYNTYNGAYYNYYIKDLRITKGVSRYSTTFTPPTTPDQTN